LGRLGLIASTLAEKPIERDLFFSHKENTYSIILSVNSKNNNNKPTTILIPKPLTQIIHFWLAIARDQICEQSPLFFPKAGDPSASKSKSSLSKMFSTCVNEVFEGRNAFSQL